MDYPSSQCPTCGGKKEQGKTTFTVDTGESIIVVRGVPATVCNQCGDEWFEDSVAEKLESIVADAKMRRLFVEIAYFDAA